MLREDITGVLYLVDMGAAASVFPRSKLLLSQLLSMKPQEHKGSFISTAGGSELPIQGTVHLQPKFAGQKHPHTFLVAEVSQHILGYPFLREHQAAGTGQSRCSNAQASSVILSPYTEADLYFNLKHQRQQAGGAIHTDPRGVQGYSFKRNSIN